MNSQHYIKVLSLNHHVEALMMEEILKDRKIPYQVKSLRDQAYGNLWQHQFGWGYIFAPQIYAELIESLYQELQDSASIEFPEDDLEPASGQDS